MGSGASCQRISCPNNCNGQGSCDTSTGLCSCAGGYSGNDCSIRLCPKGDDPLTHEVENSGDGRASQQSEVQTVTFNAGRGLGGTATLTYHDLYGQSWTTRPFAVGGDQKYRLEIAVDPTVQCTTTKCTIDFAYGGASATFLFHANQASGETYPAANTKTAGDLRNSIASLFETQSRGTSIHVTKHYSSTPAKLGGSIHQSARVIYDITIPVSMAGHDDNGGLTALTVAKHDTAGDNEFSVALYQMGDNSDAIANALTSLPNSVIPGVTVTKVSVTDSGTNSAGSSGNSYAQSYAITFNSEANAGDQNMLSCNAAPCDEDGCINRGPGVSEVRYMRHDPENHGEGINFVSQGYFIMDIGIDATAAPLSAGSIKIMWDTGSGISSAIFAVVATASEVQTALRTITGWEGVTVELLSSRIDAASDAEGSHVKGSHQFKVTFAAGYDDMGKTPTFYTMTTSDGAYADANGARAFIYDQRFSNSIWLGKTTGYFEVTVAGNQVADGVAQFTSVGGSSNTLSIRPQSGDVYHFSINHYGAGAALGGSDLGTVSEGTGSASGDATHFKGGDDATKTIKTTIPTKAAAAATRYAYLKSSATSRQTSDYFAVGSTVEVLPSTWDSDTVQTAVDIGETSYNKYRKFKITGHVTNGFNTEFAKLDSFPVEEAKSAPARWHTTNDYEKLFPDYNLKITSNNGTVRSYESVSVKVTLKEVQLLSLGHGIDYDMGSPHDFVYKLSYKGELSQDMNAEPTPTQIAEEINGFSALSGAVTVTGEGTQTSDGGYPKYVIQFDATDGDVAQLEVISTDGNSTVVTRENGWSIEGPLGAGLETMQAGGTINITARETCTFSHATAAGSAHCYDGVRGSKAIANDADPDDAINSIRDDNNNIILDGHDSSDASDTTSVITLPFGKSCDGLEMRRATRTGTGDITKSVEKNNNGKVFKITRSFLQKEDDVGVASSTTEIAFSNGKGHSALAGVSSLLISEVSSCGAITNLDGTDPADIVSDNAALPISRTLATVTTSGAASTATIKALGATSGTCSYSLQRYVITLDSMPTESAVGTKTLLYKSPVGSCSVAETTKGTFESYECSNRGACDGKSGLCTCYEGYSGESCQTQTVLV